MVDVDLRADVARRLGMKPSEIVDVVEDDGDDTGALLVTTHDGVRTRLNEDGTHVVAAPLPVPRDPSTGVATEQGEAPAVPQPDGTLVQRAPGVDSGFVGDESELCQECHGTGLRNADTAGVVETVPAPLVTAPDANVDAALEQEMAEALKGSAADALEWVDNDPGKAQAALAAERAGKNRSGLTADLEKLVQPA